MEQTHAVAENRASFSYGRSAAMSTSALARVLFTAAAVLRMATEAGQAQTSDVQPVDSGANLYGVIRDWAQLNVEGRGIDGDGRSVWATDRCSPGAAPSCLGTKVNIHYFEWPRGDSKLYRWRDILELRRQQLRERRAIWGRYCNIPVYEAFATTLKTAGILDAEKRVRVSGVPIRT
jgi:hypothetical protein